MMNSDSLSLTFAALADPTRRDILARLSEGETSVGDLAAPHEMSAPAISRHLKVLENAGLIERRIDAQWRRCRMKPEALQAASNWITFYRDFWQERFNALDEFLEQTSGASHTRVQIAEPDTVNVEENDHESSD
jgi:DNA-binding transcriptional ArsR family regulator